MSEQARTQTTKGEVRGRGVPAVSRMLADGTLIELIYDREARRTSFAVWKGDSFGVLQEVTVPGGRRLVPFSPENNLIRNEAVLLPQAPEEYASEAALFEEIRGYIRRYVDFSATFEKLATAYVFLSWIYDAFNEVPYLRLRGDYGTGKTRALIVIGSICYKPFFASGASTVSPIFHTQDAFSAAAISSR
jgi:hypothetical protein